MWQAFHFFASLLKIVFIEYGLMFDLDKKHIIKVDSNESNLQMIKLSLILKKLSKGAAWLLVFPSFQNYFN